MGAFDFKQAQEQEHLMRQAEKEFTENLVNSKFDLKENLEYEKWYDHAIAALSFTSPFHLQIKMEAYEKLFEIDESDKHHRFISLMVVAHLCNNIEMRTAWELEMEMDEYRELLKMNAKVAAEWKKRTQDIEKSIATRLKIMKGTKIGMQLVQGEA